MPSYQKKVEAVAEELGIELVWRVPSNLEAQLMLDKQLTIAAMCFFRWTLPYRPAVKILKNTKKKYLIIFTPV